ncbi:hypothetical protein QBC47DRAFT_389089 [Echria macrotheca]|uniref:Uncharacterized protein n=1 Tax=Echria macrotheca TaxID=438768 RepID=A0AAJ0F6T5_9PEZI|nr:hypothetical protein QBC47DRAFT_389089 [Echria macrotheca]
MPSKRKQRDGAAPVSSGPTSLAGQIMWLPSRDNISVPTHLELGCYNHPVVILSPRATNDSVVVLTVTSFGGQDLLVKHPKRKKNRRHYLPIHPSKPHPDSNVLLCVGQGRKLRKDSYVCTRSQHSIPLEALRNYEQEHPHLRYVLTDESYRELIAHAGFTPPPDLPRTPSPPLLPENPPVNPSWQRPPSPVIAPAEQRIHLSSYGSITQRVAATPPSAQPTTRPPTVLPRYCDSPPSYPVPPSNSYLLPPPVPDHVSRRPTRPDPRGKMWKLVLVALFIVAIVGVGSTRGLVKAAVLGIRRGMSALGRFVITGFGRMGHVTRMGF